MAYDILRGRTTTRDWSRGGGQNIGTIGAVPGSEGLSKKLVVGALVGAAAAAGFLAWRGHHHAQRFARGYKRSSHPMARTMIYERRHGGALHRVV